jgi:hypothetical protein
VVKKGSHRLTRSETGELVHMEQDDCGDGFLMIECDFLLVSEAARVASKGVVQGGKP